MVAPYIPKGRLVTRHSYNDRGTKRIDFQLQTSGFSQSPPFVDTPYSASLLERLSDDPDAGSWSFSPWDTGQKVEATNQARARFVDQLGDSSSFGATLTAERKATFGTLVSGVTTTLLSARAVARGNFSKAAKILGIAPPVVKTVVRRKRRKGQASVKIQRTHFVLPNGVQVSQRLGGQWLWWSYGVKPLMGDIHNGMDILQRPTPETRVSGAGRSYVKVIYGSQVYEIDCKTRISAHVRVSNPNLWLANQMGLVNPIQWINEAIPFSFVIDWFSNLSQIIMQMTDFVGLEIARPVTAYKCILIDTSPSGSKRRTEFRRVLEIPKAKLVFKYERFQWQRGANAVSLLVQFLNKQK